MEREGSLLVNNGNSFLSIATAWTQEPILCPLLGIIIYIGVCGICARHFLTFSEKFNKTKEGNNSDRLEAVTAVTTEGGLPLSRRIHLR